MNESLYIMTISWLNNKGERVKKSSEPLDKLNVIINKSEAKEYFKSLNKKCRITVKEVK